MDEDTPTPTDPTDGPTADATGNADVTSAAQQWLVEARRRVTENPGLEVMARETFVVAHPPETVWQVINSVAHWQADAFHNEIVEAHDLGRAGSYFEMRHTNHPIIPWPMEDQKFMGVITDWEPGVRQSVAELNLSDASGPKRTPDHQQIIELTPVDGMATRVTYSVATVRIAGLNPIVRFFFRPWARYQLRRAIDKKRAHIMSDLAALPSDTAKGANTARPGTPA